MGVQTKFLIHKKLGSIQTTIYNYATQFFKKTFGFLKSQVFILWLFTKLSLPAEFFWKRFVSFTYIISQVFQREEIF